MHGHKSAHTISIRLIYLKDLALENKDISTIDILSKWIMDIKKKCPDEKELKKIVEKLTK